ncbi:MAG: S-methyl-5-thioribose-1-phosphate isomerase [Candidatus Schekmanbacteria bacterium RBG_13_48_7]|uniref:Methylthioribose-1-phosphate isomerase n=1 Tax=Candidatus Schekmanbacteria bacterium RBG_13_48_7 TaxID=1817878 RepID=A0A1F7RI71_9BACT|nr:MAG: S-methyl-5-thioribose-1-phosphate isomerase [Candidatus Schekmanbacteria bacterium RBG_13_48_7]
MIKTVEWVDGKVVMIDQRLLPEEEVYNSYTDYHEVAEAIKSLVVRGAPAIGVAAAMGIALGAQAIQTTDYKIFIQKINQVTETIKKTRPTAVNLFWAIERTKALIQSLSDRSVPEIKLRLIEESIKIHDEDIEINKKMGRFGAELFKDGDSILTHCNAGALATAGYGTALGVIRAVVEQNKKIHVYVDETRPYLQGARLTAWELMKENIPMTLITDNMSGYFMSKSKINRVIVGADRIAANGDVANKIGTYSVAVLAKYHGIPFYVAAPASTFDLNIASGSEIPIEERTSEEITHIYGQSIAPEGVKAAHPAFDVTPYTLISAIITEKGVINSPDTKKIKATLG